jgi:hypothetical protein
MERCGQRIGIELRHMSRLRHRSHIDKLFDAVAFQQRDEFFNGMRRMPDRKNRQLSARCAGQCDLFALIVFRWCCSFHGDRFLSDSFARLRR